MALVSYSWLHTMKRRWAVFGKSNEHSNKVSNISISSLQVKEEVLGCVARYASCLYGCVTSMWIHKGIWLHFHFDFFFCVVCAPWSVKEVGLSVKFPDQAIKGSTGLGHNVILCWTIWTTSKHVQDLRCCFIWLQRWLNISSDNLEGLVVVSGPLWSLQRLS